eukprot:COSAG06_NODE_3683_length_5015_cov_112.336452_2_plen_177_part_00
MLKLTGGIRPYAPHHGGHTWAKCSGIHVPCSVIQVGILALWPSEGHTWAVHSHFTDTHAWPQHSRARRHQQPVRALDLVPRSMSFGLIPGVVRESLCRDPRLASPGGHEPRPGMRVSVWFLLQRENLLLIGRAGPPHRLPPLGSPARSPSSQDPRSCVGAIGSRRRLRCARVLAVF